ncbi:DNA cytosine methyltransferase [bacterium]|nr:DNA cytosine methyltransferase [bacterium]
MNFKFIDLFCGLGGFRIAFESLGCECVFSSDNDKYVQKTYELNFGELPFGDITKINEKDIPNHDILCAGFPCQPFSIGGKRQGFEDTRGTLFFEVLRITKEKQPKIIFLENVAGLSNHDNGKTMKTILDCLKEIGYIPFFKIINAKDVGYPQNRSRWYCVAFNKKTFPNIDKNCENLFPKKRKLKYEIESLFEKNVDLKYSITDTCKYNIEQYINKFYESQRYNSEHILIANEVRKSRCGFRCDGISPCLTAKMGTGGNNIPIIVSEKRKLTERECLRIMGYPDSYKIQNNHHQSYKQIGNSVIVPIITDIAKEIINILTKETN